MRCQPPNILLILLLCYTVSSRNLMAQRGDIVQRGRVLDSTSHQPIAHVIVSLYRPISEQKARLLSYTTTNADGAFSLAIPSSADSLCYYETSLVGYHRARYPLRPPYQERTILLAEKALTLPSVTIKAPPIRTSGDTIRYDARAFSTPATYSLEDLLKKLPGLTVEPNGRIQYQGEYIQGVYIEGQDLVGKNYRTATQVIQAEQVRSVEVVESYQPIRVLRDKEAGDKAMLNVRLRNPNMLRPSGELSPSIGHESKQGVLLGGQINSLLVNAHTQLLTTVGGGSAQDIKIDVPAAATSNPTNSIRRLLPSNTLVAYERALAPSSHHEGIDLAQLIKLDSTSHLRYQLGGDALNYTTERHSTITLNRGSSYTEYEESKLATYRRQLSLLNLRLVTNKAKSYTHLESHLEGEKGKADEEIGRNNTHRSQYSRLREIRISEKYRHIGTTHDGSVWEAGATLHYSYIPKALIGGRDALTYTYEQATRGQAVDLSTSIGYGWALSPNLTLSGKVDVQLRYDQGGLTQDQGSWAPSIRGWQLNPTTSPILLYTKDKLRCKLSIPLQWLLSSYRYPESNGDIRSYKHSVLHPGLRLSLSYRPTVRWRFTGELSYLTEQQIDVASLIRLPLQTNYDLLLLPSESLLLPHRHTVSAVYSMEFKLPPQGFFARLMLSGQRAKDNLLSSREITSRGEQQVLSIEGNYYRSDYTAQGNISQNIFDWGTTLSLRALAIGSRYASYLSGQYAQLTSSLYTLSSNIISNPMSWMELDLSGHYQHSRLTTETSTQSYRYTQEWEIGCSLTGILDSRWSMALSGYLNQRTSSGQSHPITRNLNAQVDYKHRRHKLTFSLHNLLDEHERISIRYIGADIYDTRQSLRRRECVLTYTYKY